MFEDSLSSGEEEEQLEEMEQEKSEEEQHEMQHLKEEELKQKQEDRGDTNEDKCYVSTAQQIEHQIERRQNYSVNMQKFFFHFQVHMRR
jgi:hypothetical protein